jgi:CrcB protein
MTWLMLCLGAGLGAALRYLTDRTISGRGSSGFPWGTLTVNVVGSLLLGLLVAVDRHVEVPPDIAVGAGAGFCGALTTYSTFSYETKRLVEDRGVRAAVGNVLLNTVGTLVAAFTGYSLVDRLLS